MQGVNLPVGNSSWSSTADFLVGQGTLEEELEFVFSSVLVCLVLFLLLLMVVIFFQLSLHIQSA